MKNVDNIGIGLTGFASSYVAEGLLSSFPISDFFAAVTQIAIAIVTIIGLIKNNKPSI